jgi:hypothetical protein
MHHILLDLLAGFLLGYGLGAIVMAPRRLPASLVQEIIRLAHIRLGLQAGTDLAAQLIEEAAHRLGRGPLPAAFVRGLIRQAHIEIGVLAGTDLAAQLIEKASRRPARWATRGMEETEEEMEMRGGAMVQKWLGKG